LQHGGLQGRRVGFVRRQLEHHAPRVGKRGIDLGRKRVIRCGEQMEGTQQPHRLPVGACTFHSSGTGGPAEAPSRALAIGTAARSETSNTARHSPRMVTRLNRPIGALSNPFPDRLRAPPAGVR
jgi:hypothetical protein